MRWLLPGPPIMLMPCRAAPFTLSLPVSPPSRPRSSPSSAAGLPRRPAPSRSARASSRTVRRRKRSRRRAVRRRAGDHRYGPVEGLPALVERLERKLARRERHHGSGRPAGVVVTAGGNLAFMNAVLAITDPGDEIILPAPYYFNHEMAIVMAGATRGRRCHRQRLSARRAGDRDAITPRTRAVVTVSPEQPDRRGLPGGSAARGQRALPATRHLPHPRRGLRVLHLRRRAARFAGLDRRRRRPHHLALLAVEGLRHGELAHRLHGDPGVAGRGGQQDPGHAADLPARGLAACRAGGAARSAAPMRRRTSRGSTDCATRSSRRSTHADVPCDVPPADGAFYYLVRVALDARLR